MKRRARRALAVTDQLSHTHSLTHLKLKLGSFIGASFRPVDHLAGGVGRRRAVGSRVHSRPRPQHGPQPDPQPCLPPPRGVVEEIAEIARPREQRDRERVGGALGDGRAPRARRAQIGRRELSRGGRP